MTLNSGSHPIYPPEFGYIERDDRLAILETAVGAKFGCITQGYQFLRQYPLFYANSARVAYKQATDSILEALGTLRKMTDKQVTKFD